MPFGSYIVHEIEAPTGYILSDESYPVTVCEDGEIIEITAENVKIRGNVTLTKIDEEYPDNKLSGAEFTVYSDEKCENKIGVLTENEKGVYILENLEYGQYFLKETVAPDGFIIDENIYPFSIENDGETIEISNTEVGKGFINKPKKGSVEITKTDVSTGELIPDCGIEILDKDGNVVVQGRTDENGVVTFEKLRTGDYFYHEFDAPDGYILDENSYPFLLFRDDVGEMIQQEKIKPYVPDFTLLELPKKCNSNQNTSVEVPDKIEKNLTEQVQNLCDDFDNSIGWICIPETEINYPVMYSGDNEFYLHRAVDGGYLRVGSIFLDFHCNADFTGKINILYGHNMSDGSMFADVTKFIDSNYFDSHDYGWLTTENAVYKIEFFSMSQPENYDDFYDVNSDVNLWLDSLRERSFIWRNIGISKEDRFISLSTCTGSEGSSRTVLTGRIMEV